MGETMRVRIWLIGLASIVAATAIAEAKTIKVFNPTHYAMVSLQAKKPAAKEWESDMLGKTALGVGKVKEVTLDTADCHWDLRATFDDGHKVEKKNVNMCASDVYQFTDEEPTP
jgi:hypothetical protein